MALVKKKICILGAAGVGKTSLVRRFVHSIFEDKYLSTLGVKIEKKSVMVDDTEVLLNIWDVAGEEEFFQIPKSYITGAAGYFLVIDGTRPDTLENGLDILHRVTDITGQLPWFGLLNKSDLVDRWAIDESAIARLEAARLQTFRTSALSGKNVEESFQAIARAIIA